MVRVREKVACGTWVKLLPNIAFAANVVLENILEFCKCWVEFYMLEFHISKIPKLCNWVIQIFWIYRVLEVQKNEILEILEF